MKKVSLIDYGQRIFGEPFEKDARYSFTASNIR